MIRASERNVTQFTRYPRLGVRAVRGSAAIFRRSALALCIAMLCPLTGCQAPPPDDTQMRAALSEALGTEPPRDCRLRGHAGNQSNAGVTSWLIAAGSPLQLGSEIRLLHEQQAPAGTLLALFSAAAADEEANLGTPLTEWCEYREWERGACTCRLWQMQTDSGWIACLETLTESSDQELPAG